MQGKIGKAPDKEDKGAPIGAPSIFFHFAEETNQADHPMVLRKLRTEGPKDLRRLADLHTHPIAAETNRADHPMVLV